MEIPKHIFRAYDIRGLLHEVTVDIARVVGMALVSKTGAKTVIVGRDMRETSPELQRAAIEGITSMGANVIDIGMCSTSMYNFAVSTQAHIDAGLMVTASHNPPEYNGIKMAHASGLPISGLEILKILETSPQPPPLQEGESGSLLPSREAPPAKEGLGVVSKQDILPAYIDKCLSTIDVPDLSQMKLVVDYGNGMGAMGIREVCKRLNIQMIELFPEPDAHFPNHPANPAIEETLDVLKATVLREHADLGVALDGDADRIAFIDNEGKTLRGDLTLVVFAKDVLSRAAGAKVVVAPNQSWTTIDTITELGGEVVECPIGRTFMIHKMAEVGAKISGEVSGHFFFPEFAYLESVDHAFVRMLSIWKNSGMTFADMVRPLREYHNTGEINFEVHDKAKILAALKAAYAPTASKVNELDGIRCDFDRDWWFIVRASNNEPLIRLIIEAKTEESLNERRNELVAFVEANK